MSYNRMDNSYDIDAKPLNNGERYPPIPLPAPPPSEKATTNHQTAASAVDASQMAAALEAGEILLRNPNTNAVFITVADGGQEIPKNILFSTDSIRKGFIRKVYMILLAQLLFTCGTIAIFLYHEPTKRLVQENHGVIMAAFIINLVVLLSMACCETARRLFPLNFICLGLFTVTMSLLLGAVTSVMDADLVLMAVGITALLVTALSIFAIQTKYDFTAWRGVFISIVICLFILAFAGPFLRRAFGETAVSVFGALIASFLLIYDTQLIIGGEHKYQFDPEEYIFAALTLYVDCVRILLYILRLARR